MTNNIEKLIADSKWRDIKDAPKDGTKIWLTDGELVFIGHWFEGNTRWFSDYWIEGGRVNAPHKKVTHFRTLPDDRLASVCEVLLEALVRLESSEAFKEIRCTNREDRARMFYAKEALQRADEIAKQ